MYNFFHNFVALLETTAESNVSSDNATFDDSKLERSGGRVCEVGLDFEACFENEECVPYVDKSRNGVCQCKKGYAYNDDGDCVESEGKFFGLIMSINDHFCLFQSSLRIHPRKRPMQKETQQQLHRNQRAPNLPPRRK